MSFTLLILAMLMRTMNRLRLIAISTGVVSAVYYYNNVDFVSVFWEVLFVTVNVFELSRL